MRNGVTMKDLCVRFNTVELRNDERNLVQFGIVSRLIRRIYQVSVLRQPFSTGLHELFTRTPALSDLLLEVLSSVSIRSTPSSLKVLKLRIFRTLNTSPESTRRTTFVA